MAQSKLSIAGRELVKGNFGNAITALVTKTGSSELIYPARYRNGNFFFGVNGADKAFIWGNYNSSLKAYQCNPVVSAIINRKALCETNGKQYVMDDKGKESTSPQATALRKMLLRPNPFQSGRNFKAQNSVYQQIYGYCPVLIIKPVGFEKDYSRWRMWNLPPWMIQVLDNSSQNFYEQDFKPFRSIWLTYMGHSIELNQDNIFFLKENQISTGTFMSNSSAENVSMFLPDSRLEPLKDNIANLIDSLNSRGSLTRNRGPQWLLTNDANDSGDAGLFPVDPKAKEDLHQDFNQYGIMSGQRKAIITDAKLKLQTVGFDVAQLRLLEGEIQDAKFIADGLNFPPYLLGLIDAKFDNQQIAERNLYQNAIIPDVESDDEQWTELFGLEQYGLKLETSFAHMPCLQKDKAEEGRGRLAMNQALLIEFLNNMLTWNRWRELLEEDTVLGMNKYYYELLAEGQTFGTVPNVAQAVEPQKKAVTVAGFSNNQL